MFLDKALRQAARLGSLDLVTLLLSGGACVNSKDGEGHSALHLAARNAHALVVAKLLENGANVNSQDVHGHTALHLAAERYDAVVVMELFFHGADVHAQTRNGITVLHRAAERAHPRLVADLLYRGADVHAVTEYDETALHFAAHCAGKDNDRADLVVELLEHGADVHAKTKNGKTVLHLAAEQAHRRVVAELLEHGADVHAKTENDETALHCAASWISDGKDRADVVARLLRHDADVHECTESGNTALHLAARYECMEMAEVLWKAGADPHQKNNDGETALSLLPEGSQLAKQMRAAPSSPRRPRSRLPESSRSAAHEHQQAMRSAPSSHSPLPAPSPTVIERQLVQPKRSATDALEHEQAPFRIFLSHAGEDKETIARPLYKGLQKHGLSVFLDVESHELGDNSPDIMKRAIASAPVGVFIISPEFVAKEWPMRELLMFVRRYDGARAANRTPPLLIPVFYRMSTRDCRDADIMDTYSELFRHRGLFRRAVDGSVPLDDVWHALDVAATIWSIENDIGASNLDRPNMALTREAFIQIVLERILERLHVECVQRSSRAPVTVRLNM